ncbi:MAG: FAD-dependent oxidoreductase, partial [Burkholderiales bacterium]
MASALSGGAGDEADLVVVGAGAGGMTAALVAALEGLRVVLVEATDQVGGTTATSAGTLWVPGNSQGERAGHLDSVHDAAIYLEALIGPDDDLGRRQAFLDTAREALDYLERRSAVAFTSAGKHPDYLAASGAAVAGRAVGPLPFDGRTLGKDFARIRPPLPEFMLLGGMMVGKADIQALLRRYRSWPDFLHSVRLVARYGLDRLRHPRGTRLVMGNALVARLFQSLRAAKVDIRFGWRLRDLEERQGRIVGAWFAEEGGAVR